MDIGILELLKHPTVIASLVIAGLIFVSGMGKKGDREKSLGSVAPALHPRETVFRSPP